MKIYYSQDEKDLVYRAKSLGWRFITKVDGSLEGIPPEKEAVDKNIEKITEENVKV